MVFREFFALGWRDRVRVVRAAVWVATFWALSRVAAPGTIRLWIDRVTTPRRGIEVPETMERLAWATRVATLGLLGSGECLVQALTAYYLLRSHGFNPALKIGALKLEANERFRVHMWVECQGHVVTGAHPHLARFRTLFLLEQSWTQDST